jgi:anion-transporting  ArsA/GET3 family ATPase
VKDLLSKESLLVLLGNGGVGKTTVAAALGLAAADAGLDTALITVDPSRRLRDALGLRKPGLRPHSLSAARLCAAGLKPHARLSAVMLDVRGMWDDLVEHLNGDDATRQRILANLFYQRFTEHFPGSETYAAFEQLYRLEQSHSFDTLIVDTPPAAHALEFLDAPGRISRLLRTRGLNWLLKPPLAVTALAARFAGRAARLVADQLERFTGSSALSDAADFFATATHMLSEVEDRFARVSRLIKAPRTKFVLVTTAETQRMAQTRRLIAELKARRLRLGAVVINRFADEPTCSAVAEGSPHEPLHLREIAALRDLAQAPSSTPAMRELIEYLDDYREHAQERMEEVARFARDLPSGVALALLPELPSEVGNLRGLFQVSGRLTAACQRRPERSAL